MLSVVWMARCLPCASYCASSALLNRILDFPHGKEPWLDVLIHRKVPEHKECTNQAFFHSGTSFPSLAAISQDQSIPKHRQFARSTLSVSSSLSCSVHSDAEYQNSIVPPADITTKNKEGFGRSSYSYSRAKTLRRIRACCTLQELSEVATLQAAAPALVVQAALQAPRVVQWPIRRSERQLLLDMMGTLTLQCAMNLERYEVAELAVFLGACARVHYVPEELLLPLQLRLEAEARRGHLKDAAAHVAALATHLSRLRVKAPRVWQSVGNAALVGLDQATPADLAGLLAAYARVGVANTRLFAKAVVRAAEGMGVANPQDVVTLMWALARTGYGCPSALLRSLASHLNARADEFGVVQLATVVGACVKMRVGDKELHRLLVSRSAEALREEDTALATAVALGPAMRPRHDGSLEAQQASSHAISVLVSGLCSMGPADTAVLRAAARLLAGMAKAATAGGGGGAVVSVEQPHAEQVAAALWQAGLKDEHEHLLQACRPRDTD